MFRRSLIRSQYLLLSALVIAWLGGVAAKAAQPPSKSDSAVRDATQQFATTGKAPVLEEGDSVIYPFGESQPVLQCTPLRACDVELEAGEVVHGVALGDTERWISSPLFSGDPSALVPHVVVKPREYGISTNMIVTTTRRTYHLNLVAPAKGKTGEVQGTYERRVRFYYPGDVVEQWSDAAQLEAARAKRQSDSTIASLTGAIDPGRMNFDYSISGLHFTGFRPTSIFDDGHHTYIQLPAATASADAPAFLARTESGDEAILNYRMNGSWIIVDGLFERGELLSGVGRARKSVKITNRAFVRSAGAR
ncbi:MAG: TrbG/VirB9 family P-type conjugative transfer protein [Holophagales bacterium]|nr:MAG: TrbG/VirB9 family P-type conjugative transfer protein [Holophagales bacterium]